MPKAYIPNRSVDLLSPATSRDDKKSLSKVITEDDWNPPEIGLIIYNIFKGIINSFDIVFVLYRDLIPNYQFRFLD